MAYLWRGAPEGDSGAPEWTAAAAGLAPPTSSLAAATEGEERGVFAAHADAAGTDKAGARAPHAFGWVYERHLGARRRAPLHVLEVVAVGGSASLATS